LWVNAVAQLLPFKKKPAVLDLDGTIAEVSGECKEGMDISYNGKWGYAPLVVSLANSREVLYVVNRPASRPSHDGAPEWIDKAIAWTKRAGFAKTRLRGDTDFSLTAHFDRWTAERASGRKAGVEFVLGWMPGRTPGPIDSVSPPPQLAAHPWLGFCHPENHIGSIAVDDISIVPSAPPNYH
jgi:hypothetical protein